MLVGAFAWVRVLYRVWACGLVVVQRLVRYCLVAGLQVTGLLVLQRRVSLILNSWSKAGLD